MAQRMASAHAEVVPTTVTDEAGARSWRASSKAEAGNDIAVTLVPLTAVQDRTKEPVEVVRAYGA